MHPSHHFCLNNLLHSKSFFFSVCVCVYTCFSCSIIISRTRFTVPLSTHKFLESQKPSEAMQVNILLVTRAFIFHQKPDFPLLWISKEKYTFLFPPNGKKICSIYKIKMLTCHVLQIILCFFWAVLVTPVYSCHFKITIILFDMQLHEGRYWVDLEHRHFPYFLVQYLVYLW